MERYENTANDSSRSQLLLSRWLLKNLLSEHTGREPVAHEFLYTENGKPFVNNPTPLHFSLAHCNTSIAIAIGDTPVGIDVENNQRKGQPWEQLHRFFNVDVGSRVEMLALEEDKKQFFFAHWTAMEAMVKMKGSKVAEERKHFARDFELKHDTQYLDTGKHHFYFTMVDEEEHVTVATRQIAEEIALDRLLIDGHELTKSPLPYPEIWLVGK